MSEQWSGIERRKMHHDGILPECNQVFIRLEDKIDSLIDRTDKINGRYEKHMEESQIYRHKVTKNDIRIVIIQWVLAVIAIPTIYLLIRIIAGET
jgi:hypothetical protein